METVEHANFIYMYVAINSFTSKHELRLKLVWIFSHIAMDASLAQPVNILETFNAYQYRIY